MKPEADRLFAILAKADWFQGLERAELVMAGAPSPAQKHSDYRTIIYIGHETISCAPHQKETQYRGFQRDPTAVFPKEKPTASMQKMYESAG